MLKNFITENLYIFKNSSFLQTNKKYFMGKYKDDLYLPKKIKRSKIFQKFYFSKTDSVSAAPKIIDINKPTIYIANSNNIIFNLSIEEFFYEHQNIKKPILFLWQNDTNVVIGKHQNPWKECKITNMLQDKVKLARRRSGGGAVYQDLGNLCFSFFLPHQSTIDFKKINTEIILNSFKSLGINAEASGRNDILVDDKKISGSAFKINMGNKTYDPKSLHHGTIMLNVDIEKMDNYLNPNKLKLISKGVDSVKSRVMNLCERYPNLSLNRENIFHAFEKEFVKYFDIQEYDKIFVEDEMSENFKNKIPKIFELYDKYSSWEWLYGECPEFSNSFFHKFDFGLIDLSLIVEKGFIVEINIFSDCLNVEFIDILKKVLKEIKGKFTYDVFGLSSIFDILLTDKEIRDNQMYSGYVIKMKEVFMSQI